MRLDTNFNDFINPADFLLEEIQTPPLPRTGAPIANPQVSQVIPQTGLTQTETALLSPEEQLIRQRQRNLS